jgi:hypothetical protein
MNTEIKYLLDIHKISPPPTVQTEEEVVEYLLDKLELLKRKQILARGILCDNDQYTHTIVDYNQISLLS